MKQIKWERERVIGNRLEAFRKSWVRNISSIFPFDFLSISYWFPYSYKKNSNFIILFNPTKMHKHLIIKAFKKAKEYREEHGIKKPSKSILSEDLSNNIEQYGCLLYTSPSPRD